MTSRSVAIGALLAVATAGALWLHSRTGPRTPEQIIEGNVQQMVDAAGKQDVSEIMEHVSERFHGPSGANKHELKQVIAAQVLRRSWVRVFVTEMKVRLDGPAKAQLTAKFLFARTDAKKIEALARDSVTQVIAVDGQLELEPDGAWRFINADYQPASW